MWDFFEMPWLVLTGRTPKPEPGLVSVQPGIRIPTDAFDINGKPRLVQRLTSRRGDLTLALPQPRLLLIRADSVSQPQRPRSCGGE